MEEYHYAEFVLTAEDDTHGTIGGLRFVKEHHKHISRVAFSTDSFVGSVAEAVAGHFISAEIKSFTYHELVSAKLWAAGNT